MGNAIANVSHQWRDGIAKVGYINAFLRAHFDRQKIPPIETLNQKTEEIEKTLEHLSETMQNFLDYYRPSRSVSDFNVYESLQKSLTIIEPKIKASGAEVRIEGDLGRTLHGTPNLWMQVWLNLINNALSAAALRGVEKPVIAIALESGRIRFCDNGGGIAPSVLADLKRDDAAGLGVKMSREIAARFGYKITASNISGGACFTIEAC